MKKTIFILLTMINCHLSLGNEMNINFKNNNTWKLNNYSCNATPIPSTIQSESYCRMFGISTETTQDNGGGQNVGYIDDNDWMSYNISVPTTGSYKVSYRVASNFGGNEIQIDKDLGSTILGTISVPSTGGWQSWETISHSIQLEAGEYEIGIKANIGGFNINWFAFEQEFPTEEENTDFLHTAGQNIVDGQDQNFVIKAVNLDGWMVQEGYIMEVPFGPQWEIMEGIEDIIGQQNTQEFHDAWLDNMVTESDIQQIKQWGFNSIRVPLHYNLFTLSIQDEPVDFENTVINKGYQLIDQLLVWAEKYELYLILDLHAAPGGQGEDQPISDYNPAYPSLWESGENRSKTVHLWKEIAKRYADEKWIGGYDLINETNWELGDQNQLLADLYESILYELRQVDNNHIVFIEGNWWANDFRGLTPAFDNNMVYAFHKYWTATDQASLQEFIDLRNSTNTPIWCGETGENSNQWYVENFEILEANNIGYAFWPLKKVNQIQGLLNVGQPEGLQKVLDYWNGEGSKPSVAEAKSALMEWAVNTRLDRCDYNYSVIDATTRMVGTTDTKAYSTVSIPDDNITAAHYDLGKQGHAYFEQGDLGDYGDKAWWNINWTFRNDAVDIYTLGNEYYIGETKDNEWLQYTINATQSTNYEFQVEVAANSSGGKYHIEVDGNDITGSINVSSTNGWEVFSWQDAGQAFLSSGTKVIRFVFEKGGFNLKSLRLVPTTTEDEEEVVAEGCSNSENISLDFSYDGIEEKCWVISEDINYINSWGAEYITINGVDITNVWINSNLPPRQNGKYYISFKGLESWAHIEIMGNSSSQRKIDVTTSSEIQVYPNPFSTSNVTIKHHNRSGELIKVLDIHGNILYANLIENDQTILSRNLFYRGIYFVLIEGQDQIETIKLIVD
ncbi:carbohydrate-binding protein [Flammeovirga sp. SubArs3]|uniref:carbohydrate-binding protein n=1 Tax=Flammeovirga sp. SubArs3 TaxID=2995316 RepID=UPI00248BB53F|nr:carbohydrate-binding protein [Flammeovirga sp. SubArs3]